VSLFQLHELSKEEIIFGVGNLRAILDVVEIVVASYLVPESNQSGRDIGVGHRAGWLRTGK
jgi:hypothetical protein